jgi:exosortase/archaeosortase family protein
MSIINYNITSKRWFHKYAIIWYLILYLLIAVLSLYLTRVFLNNNFFDIAFIQNFLIKIHRQVLESFFNIIGLYSNTSGNEIYFFNGNYIHILPGCSGFIQSFRIVIILILFPGPIKKKLWYIPLSVIFIFLLSIVHLILLAFAIIYDPNNYNLYHNYLTKGLFFIGYFFIWVFWLENFVLKKVKKKS